MNYKQKDACLVDLSPLNLHISKQCIQESIIQSEKYKTLHLMVKLGSDKKLLVWYSFLKYCKVSF
jgi:hypothetical protein